MIAFQRHPAHALMESQRSDVRAFRGVLYEMLTCEVNLTTLAAHIPGRLRKR